MVSDIKDANAPGCRSRESERGISLVLFALLAVVIVMVIGVAVDGVIAATTKHQHLVASEEAALAAAQRLVVLTSQSERTAIESGAEPGGTYRQILLDVEQNANSVEAMNKVLGVSGDAQPLGRLKLKLSGCDDAWCSGSETNGGTLEPGRWYREVDGPPSKAEGIDGCMTAADLPCFVPLSVNDVPANAVHPVRGANAFRATTILRTPLRFYFAGVFGVPGWRVGGTATAWIAPSNAMFLLDLSPSIHQDTHLHRAMRDPATNRLIRGLKSEFAFRPGDMNPACQSFCPETIRTDPILSRLIPQSLMTGVIGLLGLMANAPPTAPYTNIAPPGCSSNPLDSNICPLHCTPFPGGRAGCLPDYPACLTNYCDYFDLKDKCVPGAPTQHCKNHYKAITVSVGDFNSEKQKQTAYYVDMSTERGTRKIRGAEPLFSILSGINYAAKTYRRRGKGDQIGLLAFDWELFPDTADRKSRIFMLGTDYDSLIEATETNLTPAQARRASSLFGRFLFSRGLRFPNSEMYPIADLSDLTDLRPALWEAYDQLKNAQTVNSQTYAMLFTDGLPVCTGSPGAVPAEQRCANLADVWQQALDELDQTTDDHEGGISDYAANNIPIHVVLSDLAVGGHTLNITTNDRPTSECMSDKEARLSRLPYTYEDCAGRDYHTTYSDVLNTALDIYAPIPCAPITLDEAFFRGVGYLAQDPNLDKLRATDPEAAAAVDSFMTCCGQVADIPACVAGIMTGFACPNACCILYNATTKLGTSRDFPSTIFYGPNPAFYKIAAQTRGLWSPLRPRDPSYPVGARTPNAAEGEPRLCTKVPETAEPTPAGTPSDAGPAENPNPSSFPAQRQMYDPWGRTKKTQVLDAVDAVMNNPLIMLVQ